MDEIAKEFKKELQILLDRYKNRLSTPTIMRIAQPIFTKTIGFKEKMLQGYYMSTRQFNNVPLSSKEEQMLKAGGMQFTGTYNQYGQPLVKSNTTGEILPVCRVAPVQDTIDSPCGPLTTKETSYA